MQGSTMTMTSTTENLVVNQFPQPARPPNSYDIGFEIPSTSYPQNPRISKPSYVPQREEVVGHPHQSIDHSYMHVVPPTMAKEEGGEKKVALVDKLVNRILDKYEKLPATIRDQINLEEMLAKERHREVNSQSTTSRGLEQPVEGGPPEKLERFKIRTVVAEEVVKEDEKK